MSTRKMPATNLDDMPPVGLNCTKKEITSIMKMCVLATPFVIILLVFFFSVITPNSSGIFIFIMSFSLSLFITGGSGFWILKKLGRMKNNKSSKYTMQKIESYKRLIGIHDKRVIHAAKKWSTSR